MPDFSDRDHFAAARRLTIGAAFAAVAACASAGAPPGGPEDHAPPEVLAVSPDSGQVNVGIREVEFKFDEVVSDRPAGSGTSLDQIFLISPRDGSPNVGWHRDRITIKARRGFRANTAYRVTMLPGLADLRGNARKDGMTILFSTGPTFPPFSIVGRVFDWDGQRTVNGAYIEAVSRADTTLVYVTATDTAGRFDAGPLGPGTYTVRALIDANANRTLDRAEKWDTVSVTVGTTSPVVELDVIERDSTPPAFSTVHVDDSVTMHVTFDKPLDPGIPLQPALIRIQRPDSSQLEVTTVQWAVAYDRSKQAGDSARRADSTAAGAQRPPAAVPPTPVPALPAVPAPTPSGARPPPPPPKPKALPPERVIVVTVSPSTPLVPGRYVINGRGFRNLVGHTSDIRRGFTIAPPAPRDTTKRTPGDTTRTPSAPRRPPP